MYYHLRGQISSLTPTSVVIDVGGVGFDLRIPLSTYERLKGKTDACLFTHLHVRENELRLFGFATTEERELFRFVMSVNGVGPSIALSALCALAPPDLARALAAGDHKTLQKIKGVGRKLAERMFVELKDRIGDLLVVLGVEGGEPTVSLTGTGGRRHLSHPEEVVNAIAALISLGFDRRDAEERAQATYARLTAGAGAAGPIQVEKLIKECLRRG